MLREVLLNEVVPVAFTLHQCPAFKMADPQANTAINEIGLLLFHTVKKNADIST